MVVFALCVAWALATPLAAAPDEPAQIVKAAATVRGEFTGRPTPHQPGAVREFRAPAVLNSIYNLPICSQFHPKVPAGCAPHVPSSSRTVAIAVGVCQLADFVWTLRRYTVGLGKTVNLFHPVAHGWSPPPGTPLMVVVGAAAIVLYATLLFNRMRS